MSSLQFIQGEPALYVDQRRISTSEESVMKLSEAMMLGSTTCKMVRGDWNSCALGCAGNAVGIANFDTIKGEGRIFPIYDYWPWLSSQKGIEV